LSYWRELQFISRKNGDIVAITRKCGGEGLLEEGKDCDSDPVGCHPEEGQQAVQATLGIRRETQAGDQIWHVYQTER
jgi:hypothetical protein